jgi:hypothetical protein
MADSSPNSEVGDGDRGEHSPTPVSGTTDGQGDGAVSALHGQGMDEGEVASSPRTRSGSYVSVGSNADDMEVQEEEGGEGPLRIEDLEVRDGGLEPTDKAGDNREETVSLDSSVHKGEESDSSRQVEGDSESNSKKKEKRKKRKKSKEGKQQREAAPGHESESRDDSSAVSRHQPSERNLRRFFADPFTRKVLYPGQFVDGTPP